MADHDPSQDSRDGSGSPGPSEDGSITQRLAAAKDRSCPFCGQPFTSSSLGRHLDTFIRERNPKPADGVHNVTEIRKIRGSITRRHARGSAAKDLIPKKQPMSPTLAQRPLPDGNAVGHHHIPQPVLPRIEPALEAPIFRRTASAEHAARLNQAHWTATGVINNLPPRTGSTPVSRELPPLRAGQGSYPQTSYQEIEERRHTHATELALKEVLQAVHDATRRAQKPPLFDFDFFSQSYIGLRLRVLPHSSDIHRGESLGIPSEADSREITDAVWNHIKDYDGRDEPKQDPPPAVNGVDARHTRYFHHIKRTVDEWDDLTEDQRASTYRAEVMRAYSEEATRRKSAETKVVQLQQENAQLKSQLASVHTSSLPYVSQTVIKNLVDADDISSWTFEDLVSKWKSSLSHRQSLSYNHSTHLPHAVHVATTPRTSEDAATPASTQSHEYSGWGVPDGVPRPNREKINQSRGCLPGTPYNAGSADVLMQDVSGPTGPGLSHVREQIRDPG